MLWPSATFGNLVNILYKIDPVNTADLTMSITFTAAPGFAVSLYGFDLAAINGTPFNNLGLLSVIVNGTPHVIGTNMTIANTNTTHTAEDFSADPYTGATVQILLDGTDTSFYGGSASLAAQNFGRIGIDNIAFSESFVPEPASMALLAGASFLLSRRRQA